MARDDHGGDLEACIEHILAQRQTAVTNRRLEEISLEWRFRGKLAGQPRGGCEFWAVPEPSEDTRQ